jgi:3-polyprenyl-4-hydroxybenzoate decarboxylase
VPYADLREFLRDLEKEGDLRRVKAPVDPHLEVTEIVQRVVRDGGPALLFENPTYGDMPLAINVFGTDRRMAKALGVRSFDEIGERIRDLVKPEIPHGLSGFREALAKVGTLRTVPPKRVRSAPCQDVVLKGGDVDLERLPGLKTWPQDGGVFLNLVLTHTKHPETGARNLGMYRLQRHSRNQVGMHWQIHKDSNAHHAVAERRGERLPVAIAFGCRADAGGTLRGPHRLLHTGRGLPRPHRRRDDDAEGARLPDDRRGPAAAGGRPDGQGDGADLPAAHPAHEPRHRRLRPARRGRVPQLLHREH